MPLIKDGHLADDPWTYVGEDDTVPPSCPVIVPLGRWHSDRQKLLDRDALLGVRLASNELASTIATDLQYLSLVAVEFPAFRDGRAYSTARLLRERHRFTGELRAVGNVLRDQFLFMHRCGFDSFEVADEKAAEAWQTAIREISVWYQTTGDGRVAAATRRSIQRAAE